MRNGLAGFFAGFVVALAVLLLLSGRGPRFIRPAHAATRGGAGPNDLTVFTAPAEARGQQLLYIVDPHQQTFCLYRLDEQEGTIKLEAARNFRWDLQFREFNNLPPTVESIRKQLDSIGGRYSQH